MEHCEDGRALLLDRCDATSSCRDLSVKRETTVQGTITGGPGPGTLGRSEEASDMDYGTWELRYPSMAECRKACW